MTADASPLGSWLGQLPGRLWRGARTGLREPLRHPWQALASLLTIVGGVISITLGIRAIVNWIEGPGYQSDTSRLVIVDSSAAMKPQFSPQSKFDSATAEILRYVKQEPSADVAVRFTSSDCDSPYAKPAVKFGHDNGDKIEAALAAQAHTLRGKANLESTFANGIEDFRDSSVASNAKVRSIWLFLGSATDGCGSGADVAEAVKDALSDSPIKVSHVDFFALRAEQKKFKALQKALEDIGSYVRVVPVANKPALRKKIEETAQREAPSEE
jgi:hypothetical protein